MVYEFMISEGASRGRYYELFFKDSISLIPGKLLEII